MVDEPRRLAVPRGHQPVQAPGHRALRRQEGPIPLGDPVARLTLEDSLDYPMLIESSRGRSSGMLNSDITTPSARSVLRPPSRFLMSFFGSTW